MYEDAWYNSFASEPQPKKEAAPQPSKKTRTESLLKQTNGNYQVPDNADSMLEPFGRASKSHAPPKATLVRRAQSYSDFFEAAQAYIPQEDRLKIHEALDVAGVVEESMSLECRYDNFENDILDSSHEEYKLYLDQLTLSERHLDNLLADTTSSLDLLATLSESFKAVEAQTTAFQAQCEDLLEEQKRLRNLADDVGTDLQYYSYMEPLTRRLNAPGTGRLIQNGDFLEMLTNLNVCIEFMDEHPNYRDSSTYKTRYTTLLQKALAVVQNAFSTPLREVLDDVSSQLRSKEQSETAQYVLLYGRYESVRENFSPQLQRFLKSPEFAFGRRGDTKDRSSYTVQWHGLFQQLLDSYINSRQPVGPLVQKTLQNFASGNPAPDKEFQLFARRCVLYVFDICQSEADLAAKFFQDGPLMADYPTPAVAWNMPVSYAERIVDNRLSHVRMLHNSLAPYLSNGDLSRICDLVSWLEATYVSLDSEEDETRDGQRLAAQHLLTNNLWPLADQLFIKAASEVEFFRPTPADLKIASSKQPLAGARPTSSSTVATVSSIDGNISATRGVTHAYPTVQTAVKLLVLYNESMHESTRQKGDVLYEIVHRTTESLQKAATIIKRTSNIMDAQIFLIRNLMVIENLFMTHEIPESIRQSSELDFTPFWDTLKELQTKRQTLNPMAYISAVWTGKLLPAVVAQVLDARKELEKVLVQQITGFTKYWQSRLDDKDQTQRDKVAKATKELEDLLNRVFDDETTRAALWRMIRTADT